MTDQYNSYAGLGNGYAGVTLAPGARIAAFVHASGSAAFANMDPVIEGRGLYTTLNAALAQCRANAGDVVFVLQGHTENISVANQMTNLVAGTRIIGGGYGTLRPTFTWTAAAATFLFNVANVSIENCILNMAGDLAGGGAQVTSAPITVSAAGCRFANCFINMGVDSGQYVTNGITTTASGTYLFIDNCRIYSATAATPTSLLKLVGADYFLMYDSIVHGATTSATGGVLLFATTASTFIDLRRNSYNNKKAASQCCVVGLASVSGVSRDESFGYLDNASLTPWLTSVGLMVFHRPTISNNTGETGSEIVGTVSA